MPRDARPLEPLRAGPVARSPRDTSSPVPASTIACMLLPRPEMRMTAHFTTTHASLRAVRALRSTIDADLERLDAIGAARRRSRVRIVATGHDEHHADAAIEGAVHFVRRRCCPCAAASRRSRGAASRDFSSCAQVFSGSTRGMFSRRPPPVMCAMPFTGDAAPSAPAPASRRCAWARCSASPSVRLPSKGS